MTKIMKEAEEIEKAYHDKAMAELKGKIPDDVLEHFANRIANDMVIEYATIRLKQLLPELNTNIETLWGS